MEQSAFISFSSKDREIATLVCNALEERGIGCWISSRDVKPGENFQAAIVQAIRNAKAMILVFSGNANNSDEIKKEIVLAGQSHLVVIPVRVEDVKPNDALAYEFATRQWVDLFEDWENSMHRLLEQLQSIAGVDPITLTRAETPFTVPAHLPRTTTAEKHALSLVVLPFSNLSGDRRHDRLVDGITEQLTGELARIDDAHVINHQSAAHYRGDALDVTEVGRELGVRYVVKGNVRTHGAGLRVAAQLINAEIDQPLWADRFDVSLSDAMHDVVGRLFPELRAQLYAADNRAPQPAPASPAAAHAGQTVIRPRGPAPAVVQPTAVPAQPAAAHQAQPEPTRPPPVTRPAVDPAAAAQRQTRTVQVPRRQNAPFRLPFWVKLAVVAVAGGVAVVMLGAERRSVVEIVSWMLIAAGGIQMIGTLAGGPRSS